MQKKENKGFFKITSQNMISEMKVGDIIQESDYSTLSTNGIFTQMEYHKPEKVYDKIPVKPGLFSINKKGGILCLTETSYSSSDIMDKFVVTDGAEKMVNCFFNKLDIYKELKLGTPKRSALLYGPAGTGKTTLITKVCNKYISDGKTLVVIWSTSTFDPYEVKSLVKTFDYTVNGIEKIILVAEDIGGIEAEEKRFNSDPSLLSLLDNKEETFKIPVFIFGTTNYPASFLDNIIDRPDRFDEVIEVGHPPADVRVELFKFFCGSVVTPEDAAITLLKTDKCSNFTPAHLKEVMIRSRLYDRSQVECINEIINHKVKTKKGFSKGNSVGIGIG